MLWIRFFAIHFCNTRPFSHLAIPINLYNPNTSKIKYSKIRSLILKRFCSNCSLKWIKQSSLFFRSLMSCTLGCYTNRHTSEGPIMCKRHPLASTKQTHVFWLLQYLGSSLCIPRCRYRPTLKRTTGNKLPKQKWFLFNKLKRGQIKRFTEQKGNFRKENAQ